MVIYSLIHTEYSLKKHIKEEVVSINYNPTSFIEKWF